MTKPTLPAPSKQSKQRSLPRRHKLAGPDTLAAAWQPPGVRKNQPLQPVSAKVRRDPRQARLNLEGDA
jgi:hypothetical protein